MLVNVKCCEGLSEGAMKPDLGFREGFLEEVIPELKTVGVHRAGGTWQGEGRMCVSTVVGNLAWAGTVRRVMYWGRRPGSMGLPCGSFKRP